MRAWHSRSLPRRSRRWSRTVRLLLSLVFASLATKAVAAESFREWEARMAAFYEANPELKAQKGSGWKPYNRVKYFMEQRILGVGEIPAGARWNAFLRKKELERSQTKAALASWFSLGPENLTGRILDLKFDPNDVNVIYAGAASGGIWRSTNGGVSWTPLDDELPTLAVGAIGLFPSDSDLILIGTGEATFNGDRVSGVGVLKSIDGGATWSTTGLSYPATGSGHGFNSMEVNPINEVVLAAVTDGIWRSTDRGDTWALIGASGNYTDVKWKPGSVDTAYAVRSGTSNPANAILRSVNGGLSFSSISNGLPPATSLGRTRLGVTGANPAYIYASISNQQTGAMLGLYRSTDGGDSWSLRTTQNIFGSQGWYDNMIILYPENPERLFVGGIQLYRSVDGGVTFTQVGANVVHVDQHAAAYRPGTNNNLFVGNDGGVWETTNRGNDWIDRNAGLVTYQFYDICVSQPDPLRAWGGTQDNGTDRWVNSTSWLQGLGGDGMVCNGHPSDPLTVYGEIQNGVHYKSTNGGANWFPINNGIDGGGWVTPVDLDPRNGNHLFSGSESGVFRTSDGGASWVLVDPGWWAIWISISPADSQRVWTIGFGSARFSTNDGQTWNTASPYGLPTGNPTKILAHPLDPNTAFATFSSYAAVAQVVRTTDLGVTWQDVSGDLPPLPVNAIVVDPQYPTRWYIGTDVGVWATADEGQTWVPFETGLPNVVVTDLEIQDSGRKLRAGTYGRGLWEIDLAAVTAVGPADSPRAIDLMLDPPYPNPVKGETILRYAARRDGQALTLAVYDVQGRLVTRLAEHAADGIIRQVRWAPGKAASGVYFAMLRVGADQRTQKLVHID